MGPAAVIEEVTASKLMGRGGAAFPTGRKWAAVAAQPRHPALPRVQRRRVRARHVQGPGDPRARPVRARRGDDDRRRSRSAPRAATCTSAASTRWPRRRLADAIDQAQRADLLGPNVAGSGWSFDIELRIGAGAYIAGEETALFESIEGGAAGATQQAAVPGRGRAVRQADGGQQRRDARQPPARSCATAARSTPRIGTEGSTGPKLFCISGNVERPGVYEVEFGATLRDLLELAGGVTGGAPDPGDPAGRRRGRLRRSRQAGHAAHVRGHARRRRDARVGRDPRVSTRTPTSPTPCAGSRRSSATSRAANASRAASAPCARRS